MNGISVQFFSLIISEVDIIVICVKAIGISFVAFNIHSIFCPLSFSFNESFLKVL